MPRPAKPHGLHVAHGTLRARTKKREAAHLMIEASPVGDPPEFFDPEAISEWNRLTTHEVYSKVLSGLHRSALIEYCTLYSRMIADAKGMIEMTSTQRQSLNSLRMQLGLTPASQSKVQMPGKEKSENPWAALANS